MITDDERVEQLKETIKDKHFINWVEYLYNDTLKRYTHGLMVLNSLGLYP